MKKFPLHRFGWRFYLNTVIFFLLLAAVLVILMDAVTSPMPWLVYVLGFMPAYWLGSAVFDAYRVTHPGASLNMATTVPQDAGMEAEAVTLRSRDGLHLSGWWVFPAAEPLALRDDPVDNSCLRRAAVILVHGYGSRGMATVYHASALTSYGYHVLMFDLRAHGASEGDTSSYGWNELYDLLGAVAWVRSRPDVDPGRVGVLGLSLGGQIALRAAALDPSIKAVVAEDPSAAVMVDGMGEVRGWERLLRQPLDACFYAVLPRMNGAKPPPGVLATIHKIAPRPLLLITHGKGWEGRRVKSYFEAAAEPKELWVVPHARHVGAYFVNKEAYAQKVIGFFNQALS